jgi:hypothetical protein
MGKFSEIDADIRSMAHRGHSIQDAYIYWKDYVSIEDVIRIFEEEKA